MQNEAVIGGLLQAAQTMGEIAAVVALTGNEELAAILGAAAAALGLEAQIIEVGGCDTFGDYPDGWTD